ncbi:MAG: hypothetical protein ACJAWV_001166 [Flammeovirgaceae bacterium]|jgi:hypothetical protein
MTLEEIKTLLNEFVKQHNLQQKALDSCEECMVNSMEEDADVLGGFSRNEVITSFISHKLIFEHCLYHTPFVKTKIGIYKKEEDDGYLAKHY